MKELTMEEERKIGGNIHKILNETINRKITIEEYKKLVESIAKLITRAESKVVKDIQNLAVSSYGYTRDMDTTIQNRGVAIVVWKIDTYAKQNNLWNK